VRVYWTMSPYLMFHWTVVIPRSYHDNRRFTTAYCDPVIWRIMPHTLII
jgi:hypothetical protein